MDKEIILSKKKLLDSPVANTPKSTVSTPINNSKTFILWFACNS